MTETEKPKFPKLVVDNSEALCVLEDDKIGPPKLANEAKEFGQLICDLSDLFKRYYHLFNWGEVDECYGKFLNSMYCHREEIKNFSEDDDGDDAA
jgi:hypothetical protein